MDLFDVTEAGDQGVGEPDVEKVDGGVGADGLERENRERFDAGAAAGELRGGVRCGRLRFADSRDETVAAARDGFDVFRMIGVVRERTPEGGNALVEIIFLDKAVWPGVADEDVFGDNLAVISDEVIENFKGLHR